MYVRMRGKKPQFAVLAALVAAGVVMASGNNLVGGEREGRGVVAIPQPKTGEPLLGLTADQLQRFKEGQSSFDHPFQVAEGLGPIMNQNRCAACHTNPAIGGAGTITVTRFGIPGQKGGFDPLEELGGSLLQSQFISAECQEVVPEEATYVTTRATPACFGFGLVEAIPDEDIAFNADNPPSASVSGRVHMVQPLEDQMGPMRVGRFGWKAQVATVLSFSGDASLNEMGITNDLLGMENAPNGNEELLAMCDSVPDPEDVADGDGVRFIDRITDFQRFLSPPPQTPKSGMSGEALFAFAGCTDCHIPSFTTPDDENLEDALRNKTFKPYSDFLLHDMGEFCDGIPQGEAQACEVRTPALWGLLYKDPLLHDASVAGGDFATRVNNAILTHGQSFSEAEDSVTIYNFVLLPEERAAVLAFLASLGRAEFDQDGDNDTELDDFFGLKACADEVDPIMPDAACAVHDIDQDTDVNFQDFESFMIVFDGARRDCNCNGVVDLADVFNDVAADADQDGVLDECNADCLADIDACDNAIGVSDLLALLAAWGPCEGGSTPCPADVNGDSFVDVLDLLELLAAWGPCI